MILSSFISLEQAIKLTDVKNWEEKLCQTDIEKYHSFIRVDDKMLFIIARILLLKLVRKFSPDFSLKDILYTPLGKPYTNKVFDIGITHSGQYCAVAVSDCFSIGIDIQSMENIEIEDYSFILEKEDFDFLSGKKKTDQLKFFFQKWTAMEALMKADGRGFHLEPTMISKKGNGYSVADNHKIFYKMPSPSIERYALSLICDNDMERVQWLLFDQLFSLK